MKQTRTDRRQAFHDRAGALSHSEVDHSRGEHSMFTGYRPSPALTYPSMGSVTAHEFGPRADMPPYICLPTQGSQFLGSGYLSECTCGPFASGRPIPLGRASASANLSSLHRR